MQFKLVSLGKTLKDENFPWRIFLKVFHSYIDIPFLVHISRFSIECISINLQFFAISNLLTIFLPNLDISRSLTLSVSAFERREHN